MDHPARTPLVSCIIIFLNEERYLEEAILSVLSQDYQNKELLLVDDGSTDGSPAIGRRYADEYPGVVRYLRHDRGENRGMSASRNLGIRHAKGTYLAFLDGDDCWFPGKLSLQTQMFSKHPSAGMVCGATLYWHSWNSERTGEDYVAYTGEIRRVDRHVLDLEQDRLYPAGQLVHRLYPLAKGATPSASGYMVTRELAERIGGFDESFRGVFEDQVFRAKVFLAADTYVSSKCFDRYRQHEASSVHVARRTGEIEKARRRFFDWYRSYAKRHYPADADLLRAIRREKAKLFRLRSILKSLTGKFVRFKQISICFQKKT